MTLNFLKNHYLFLLAAVVVTLLYTAPANKQFGFTDATTRKLDPVISDGAGYYAYLPQVFIYKTKHFEFIDSVKSKYPNSRFDDNFNTDEQGMRYNKYFVGTAILQAPSFLLAHFTTSFTELDCDGYSLVYQLFVYVSALVFTFLGLWFIYCVLAFYAVPKWIRVITILALALGTNLSYYTIYYPSYSHVYSFAAIAYFVLLLHRWRANDFPHRGLLGITVLLGLIVLIRPTNGLIALLLFFVFPTWRAFGVYIKELVTRHLSTLLLSVLLLAGLVAVQIYNTHQQLGVWALNAYTGEGFDYLFKPQIFSVLFSFDKGLFVYAPVLLIAVAGLFAISGNQKRMAFGFSLTLFAFVYITSSWWCWWYGGGLGMRPMIDCLVLFAIPFAVLFTRVQVWIQGVLLLLTLAFVSMYQVYEYQMNRDILHYNRMSDKQFKQVFMKTGMRFAWWMHMEYDQFPAKSPSLHLIEPMTGVVNGTLFQWNYDDDPKISVQLDTSYVEWAGRLTGKFAIHHDDQNPNVMTRYYKGDSLVLEKQVFFGGYFPEKKKLEQIDLYFVPKLALGEYTRVELELFEPDSELKVQDLKFHSYYFRK